MKIQFLLLAGTLAAISTFVQAGNLKGAEGLQCIVPDGFSYSTGKCSPLGSHTVSCYFGGSSVMQVRTGSGTKGVVCPNRKLQCTLINTKFETGTGFMLPKDKQACGFKIPTQSNNSFTSTSPSKTGSGCGDVFWGQLSIKKPIMYDAQLKCTISWGLL